MTDEQLMNQQNAILERQNVLMEAQNDILSKLFDKSLYSHAPFASLLMSELSSYEDMDDNGLLFCVDFIFDVPYEQLSPMLQSCVGMHWPQETEEVYEIHRTRDGEFKSDIKVLSFEEYRDGLPNEVLRDRVTKYIAGFKRILEGGGN
jgi:hypothetical protein